MPTSPISVDQFEIWLSIFWVTLLVFANGFFVAAEFALVKVRSSQLEMFARKGSSRAKAALAILSNLDSYLSACQLGITIASLALGWVGEPFVSRLLQAMFLSFGVDSEVLAHRLAVPVGFAIITFLHIVVGEQAPKILAIQKARDTTLMISLPLRLFFQISYPLIWMVNSSSQAMLRVMGIEPITENEFVHSAEELHLIVSEAQRKHQLSLTAKDLVINILDLKRKTAKRAMIPRTQVEFFSTRATFEENLEKARRSKHTRFPLSDPDLDNVVGIIHLKDVLWLFKEKGEKADLKTIVRPVIFVPELASLEKLLRSMQARRMQAAMVVDEFGSVAGMVTFEDILEEIVGEIEDEFDSEVPLWQKAGLERWLVDGRTPLYQVSELLGVEFDPRDATTIGGYILEVLGNVPEQDVVVPLPGEFEATVTAVDRSRIKQVVVAKRGVESGTGQGN